MLLITLPIMVRTIWSMFEGVRPFDWLMLFIEVAVVGLILYEIIADDIRRRAEARHRLFVDTQTVALAMRLTLGERLQRAIPNSSFAATKAAEDVWRRDVDSWTETTQLFLAGHCSQAAAEFMRLTDVEHVIAYVGTQPHGYYVRGESVNDYRNLIVRLENLRRIISRPEAYF
ncbi:MAG TPA: hypothetical protein VJ999_12960 [Candidatus Sulfotelmatobacter sp.]|nr:hypothetical protein [Candidatus Sulfotelmatobacter sp.]